jgi:dolichol-phosphate mannosyltransferase
MKLFKTVSIVIPTYNEIKTITKLIKNIKTVDLSSIRFKKEIIVINDGSTDGTKSALAKIKGIKVLNTKNQGKGKAVQTGIKISNSDYILIQDADLEYDPQDYFALLKPLLSNKKKIAVYGSRTLMNQMKYKNKIFIGKHPLQGFGPYVMNKILQIIFFIFYKQNISDLLTGYKIYERKFFDHNKIITNGFETDHEISAKLIKKNYKILEVPVNYYPRTVQEGKKIKFIDGIKAINTLIKFL